MTLGPIVSGRSPGLVWTRATQEATPLATRRSHGQGPGGRGSVVFMHNPGLSRTEPIAPDAMSRNEWVVCWNAFTSDASCAVTVLDTAGVIHFMNGFGRELLGLPQGEPIEGRNQSELIPAPAHEARMSLVTRVAQGEGSLAVLGAIGGLFRRTVYRALDRTPGHERVLTVCVPLCQPVTINDLAGQQQVYCETCLDLGPLSALKIERASCRERV